MLHPPSRRAVTAPRGVTEKPQKKAKTKKNKPYTTERQEAKDDNPQPNTNEEAPSDRSPSPNPILGPPTRKAHTHKGNDT